MIPNSQTPGGGIPSGTSRTNGTTTYNYYYDGSQLTSVTGSMKDTLGKANPLRYRGYVYDPETGLYCCQSRYYDPEIGRFINADGLVTTGQGFVGNNMFAYCGNNPVNYTDPSGTYRRSFGADIRSVYFEAPGQKGTALAKLQKEAGPWGTEGQKVVDTINKGFDFIEDRFSTPEKVSNTLGIISGVFGSVSSYFAGIALKLHIPTFGIGTQTARVISAVTGFIAAILGVASNVVASWDEE